MQVQVTNCHKVNDLGPLGGTSTVYTIRVTSVQDSNDDSLCNNYEINKTFSEFIYFQSKLNKSFPKSSITKLPKTLNQITVTNDQRLKALSGFITSVSDNEDLLKSTAMLEFLEVDKHTKLKASSSKKLSTNLEDVIESVNKESDASGSVQSNQDSDENIMNYYDEDDKNVTISVTNSSTKSENVPNFLPKNDKKQAPTTVGTEEEEDLDLFLPTPQKKIESNSEEDIFEKFKETESTKDADQELFITSKDETNENADANLKSDKVSKKSKINLFEELDYGDRVFKEDKSLFFIPDKEDSNQETQSGLEMNNDEEAELLRVDDSIDDLMKILKPKEKSTQEITVPIAKPKPKPKPAVRTKPQNPDCSVKPNTAPKPKVASRPSIPNKPSLPAKPSKPTPPSKPAAKATGSIKADNLSHVDIDQYINQQASADNVNLFD